MAFQRSFSKVWWGSDSVPSSGFYIGHNYNFYNQHPGGYSSLDCNLGKSGTGNLSRIQEVDNENSSKLWEKQDSPGSLRSQDSGFSDNDESQSNGGHRRSSRTSTSPKNNRSDLSENNCSPVSAGSSVQTPPTVIRRTNVQRPITPRQSLSAPNSPHKERKRTKEDWEETIPCELISQIDRISFINTTPKTNNDHQDITPSCRYTINKDSPSPSMSVVSSSLIRRRRVVNRKSRRSLMPFNNISDISFGEYNNETVYLGNPVEEDANNNTIKFEGDAIISPLKSSSEIEFTASTSTPKKVENMYPEITEYENPLLNGHPPSMQSWFDNIRTSYESEVMSTLQTKSIFVEALKNLKITTNAVTKIIRQLQQRSVLLQADFDRMERILKDDHSCNLQTALLNAQELLENVDDFRKALERRSVFFGECRSDRKRFEDNIEHIKLIVKDTRISLEKHHYIQVASIYDDVQVLKRFLLITLRLVFEKLIRVIVQSIEESKCDLMLRANINMITTLSNMEYEGFASLSDAFTQNETVRGLLMVCIDNKSSSVRALALRALATICSSPEAILQLSQAGGLDIIKDVLQPNGNGLPVKRSEAEMREAVSLLTQVTAPWHGGQCQIEGLKDSAEVIVEGLTDLIERTNCLQTLLLCTASLNNLSRVEMTSVYSIMSNETITKLKDTIEHRGTSEGSIFLYEQIVAMLHNMSGNKKCHSHLANGSIINFITSIFQVEFNRKYTSRAETEAQRRTIKSILHTYIRLIHDPSLGHEILEQNFAPVLSKLVLLENDVEYGRDISVLARHLNESCSNKSFNRSLEGRGSTSSTTGTRLNINRQESYV